MNAGSFQLLLCHKSDSQSTSTSSSVFLSPSISRSSRQTLSNRHSGGREGGPRRLQSRPLRPCGLRRDVKKVSLITAANNGRRKERRMEEGANINTFFPPGKLMRRTYFFFAPESVEGKISLRVFKETTSSGPTPNAKCNLRFLLHGHLYFNCSFCLHDQQCHLKTQRWRREGPRL